MDLNAWWTTPLDTGTAIVVVIVAAVVGGLTAGALRQWLRGWEVRHRAAGDHPDLPPRRILSRVVPLAWLTVVLSVALDATDLFEVGALVKALHRLANASLLELSGVSVSPMTLLTVLVVLIAFRALSRGAQAAISGSLKSNPSTDAGVIAALQRLTHYAVMAVGIMVGLQTAGVNLSALVAASAVFAVGIGFGLQNIAQNFISGIMLLIERTIKPGDILTVEGNLVRVQEMGIRATVARTLDDEDLIIPNSKLVEGVVINHSLRTNVVRARAKVGVAYESDLNQVFAVLRKTAETFPDRSRSKEPVVLLTDFGSSSIDFEVSVWVPSAFVRNRLLSELRLQIWRALRDANITIAFPQVDVHFDPPVVDALRHRAPQGSTP